MGRRVKQPESVHREAIFAAAERLFLQKGIAAATMDEIAKTAGYSKATLYVYFTGKEEIVSFLVLKSMELLLAFLQKAAAGPGTAKEKYGRICQALADCQAQHPLYFTLALGRIEVDPEREGCLPVEREIFEAGERINRVIAGFLRAGAAAGELQPGLAVLPTVFLFWASLAGVIQMAANKELYLQKAMGLSKQEFLEFGFRRFYKLIEREEKP